MNNISSFLHRVAEPVFISINKRFRFVLSVVVAVAAMGISTLFYFDQAWLFIPLLIVMAYFLTYFSILEGIEKREWFFLFIMPVCVTVAFYAFYMLFFPARWITRIPLLFFYGLSFYATLLSSNIFNVGVEKSLKLYLAAFVSNYLLQTVTLFLILSLTFLFKQVFLINAVVVFIILLPLSLQLFWSTKPKTVIDAKVWQYALLLSFIMAQAAMVVSFVPLQVPIIALFLTACYYSLAGLLYHYLDKRLFKDTVREFSFVIVVITAMVLLSLQW